MLLTVINDFINSIKLNIIAFLLIVILVKNNFNLKLN